MRVSNNSEDGTYLSAQVKGGVRVRKPPEEQFDKRLLCIAPLKQLRDAYSWALTQIGKPYDWKAILGIAGGYDDWHDGQDYFCSELVAAAFEGHLRRVLIQHCGVSLFISVRTVYLRTV